MSHGNVGAIHPNTYPNAPCREYVFYIFPLQCGHFSPNVGQYSIHGAYGCMGNLILLKFPVIKKQPSPSPSPGRHPPGGLSFLRLSKIRFSGKPDPFGKLAGFSMVYVSLQKCIPCFFLQATQDLHLHLSQEVLHCTLLHADEF